MIFYTCGWWKIATTPAKGAFQLSLLIPLMPFVAKRTVIGPVWGSSGRKCRETHCYTKRHFADATLGSGARKSTCILGHVQVNGWTAEAITLETRFFYCGYSAKQKVFSVLTDLSLHSFERMPIGTADHMCTTFYLRAHSHSLFLSDTRTVHLSRRSQVLERGCLGLNKYTSIPFERRVKALNDICTPIKVYSKRECQNAFSYPATAVSINLSRLILRSGITRKVQYMFWLQIILFIVCYSSRLLSWLRFFHQKFWGPKQWTETSDVENRYWKRKYMVK